MLQLSKMKPSQGIVLFVVYIAAGFVQPEAFGAERAAVQGDASPQESREE